MCVRVVAKCVLFFVCVVFCVWVDVRCLSDVVIV